MSHVHQIDLVSAKVNPADRPFDEEIATIGGKAKPFYVTRSWSGPSGHYNEQWSIRRGGREIVFNGPMQQISVRGMQSATEWRDRFDGELAIEPGIYQLVFVVERHFMGSVDIQVKALDPAVV
ncbi:MAG: hypothetical protein ABR507_09215 [Actinomycetota bacterium]|nr:hypothetical protein [Actinomycetota bacterium]